MSIGGKPYCMVKSDLFVGPLGWLLRKMGGIPVDRKRGSNVMLSVIKEMKRLPVAHLALAPEGTRKPVKRWKAGFHTIAREVGCPVYMGYFDWGTKHVSRGQKVELTDDAKADLEARKAATVQNFENYLPGPLEMAKNGKVVSNGNYVMLIISGDNAKAVELFNAFVKAR